MWPDRRILDLFKTEFPIVLAPMAGAMDAELVIAAALGGALGPLPCAMLTAEKAREQVNVIRQRVSAPLNMNFFCHKPLSSDPARDARWKQRLVPYYKELGLDPAAPVNAANRAPFDAAMCEVVEELKPEIVSFHFGLPDRTLLKRVKAAGCKVMAAATIVKEAIWLEENGADVIIAQGAEAGGHRGGFRGEPAGTAVGLMALVPLLCDAVDVPVIAAGGLMDGRGIAAALTLGAAAAQLGTAILLTPEAGTNAPYRAAVAAARETDTVFTSAFSGRAARGIRNRMSTELAGTPLPPYPVTNALTRTLRRVAAERGLADYLSLWAGQGLPQARALPTAELVAALVAETGAAFARSAQ